MIRHRLHLTVAAAFAVLALPCLNIAQAETADPGAEELAARAEAIIDRGIDSPKALEEAENAVKASIAKSLNAHALVERARLFMIRGDESPESLKLAQTVLETAAAVDPSYARVYVLQGYVNLQKDDLNAAEFALRKAVMAGSNDPWLKLNYALLYDRIGPPAKAIQMREEVIASGTTNRKALMAAFQMLQRTYETFHDRPNSDRTYRRLLALWPQDAYIRGDYARALITQWADFDAGQKMAEEALALMDYPQARQTVSLALYARWAAAKRDRKDFGETRALLDKARAYDPGASMVPTCALRSPNLFFLRDALTALENRFDPSRQNC